MCRGMWPAAGVLLCRIAGEREETADDGAFKSSQSAVWLHAAAGGASHAWRVCGATGSSRTMIHTDRDPIKGGPVSLSNREA